MCMQFKILYLLPLLLVFLIPPAASDAFLVDNRTKIYGDYVQGRPMNTSFIYEIEKTHEPIDTALVIDRSGSMGGVIEDAKEGAKSYVDNTLTSEGDENAVVEFHDYASTIQSLTSSKSAAKDAIDSIEADGGTELPAGVSEGHDALESGNNDLQVMIVLADGGGDNPGDEADAARADGIEVHGIMYGSDASTSEFESLTNADECTNSSSENDDDDNCWYAETGTINKVYSAIQEDISPDADAELHVRMPNYAKSFEHSVDNDLGDTNEYILDGKVKDGVFHRNFTWYPTENGTNKLIKPGTSFIEVTESGSTSTRYFRWENYSTINYTDYRILEKSLIKRAGEVNASLLIDNDGNVPTIQNEVGIYDESGNTRTKNLESLDAGEQTWVNFSISNTNDIIQSKEDLRAKADFGGIWPNGEGEVGEQNEVNNAVLLGYPPRITDYKPDSIEFLDDTYTANYTFNHPDPSEVQGNYDKRVGGDLRRNADSLDKIASNMLETDELDIEDVEVFYNMTLNVSDGSGATTIYNHSYFVENPPPTIVSREPSDGGVSINSPVQLGVTIRDPNDDTLDVSFYDASDGSLIGQNTSMLNGTQVENSWEVETLGRDYTWTVEVSDPWDTYSEQNTFTKIVGASYRVQTEVDTQYSTIITSDDSRRTFFFEAENRVPFERNLITEVSGAGATIDGEKEQEYRLGDGEKKRFSITLSPDRTGSQTLFINTTNTNTSTKIVDTVPVDVRDYETTAAEAVELPGLSLIQLLMLLLVSSTVFFVRL